jgi:putative transposase
MRRREIVGNTRFLTFSCYRRLPLLCNPAIADAFASEIAAARRATQFRLYGWAIMPEHVHLLLRPRLPEFPVSRVLGRMKGPFATRVLGHWRLLNAPILPRITDSQGTVRFWLPGGGYDRNIRSTEDFHEKLRYIHRNPVTRGLVTSSTDWPWSSARAYASGGAGMIEIDTYP